VEAGTLIHVLKKTKSKANGVPKNIHAAHCASL
jgi:hypothetical protein